jgi:hypothetical protein
LEGGSDGVRCRAAESGAASRSESLGQDLLLVALTLVTCQNHRPVSPGVAPGICLPAGLASVEF